MVLGLLTLLSALTISAVAIYYSVAGLAAIFAAAVIPIIIMGVALEVGKLVTAVWLHRHWKQATWWLKTYLSVAVFVLMFITSMGIFGFLSKAHIEQTSMSQEQVALIETIDDKLVRSEAKIDRWTEEMNRLLKGEDVRVDNLIDREQQELDKINALIKAEKDDVRKDFDKQIQLQNDRIDQARVRKEQDIKAAKDRFEGSLGGGAKYDKAVEEAKANELSVASSAQREIRNINGKLNDALAAVDAKYASDIKTIQDRIQDLRNQANNKTQDIEGRITELEGFIDTEQKSIDEVREEKFNYEKTYRKLEAEVGPIKYIAEFIYGEQADQNLLEAAVRWVIIIIIFVFDPLAVLLLIASQYTFSWRSQNKGGGSPGKLESPSSPEPDHDSEPFTEEEWDEAHRMNYEFDRANKISQNIPPDFEEEKEKTTHELLMEGFEEEQKQRELEELEEEKEPVLSKKKTDQYLLWEDIDPEPQESVTEEEISPQKSVDPNQLDLDLNQNPVDSKKYVRTSNPFFYAKEKVNDVDDTIEDMKDKGEWPDQATKETQEAVSEQLEKIDDLDAWNNWVEKANEEAEKNPETFEQNSEQNDDSIFNKINEARENFDPAKIKELEITEEQYRDASQKHIISLIERLKKGLIKVDDLTESEAQNITSLLEKK
jgi:hypothetical protein